jgi:hypothetical protein
MVTSRLGVTKPFVSGTVLGAESRALSTSSGTLAAGFGFTIPSGTTRILCIPTATTHWNPIAAATTSVPSYSQAANEAFVLEHDQLGARIRAAAATPDLNVVYLGYPA